MRQKKARDEKRREKRIEMEENKKQGKCKYGWFLPMFHSLREPGLSCGTVPRS